MTLGTAVVTGAAGGLGRVLVERLTLAGYDVVGTDLVGADRELDVTDAAACRALAAQVRPQVWVNNAGVLGAGDAATQPDDLVERVVRVNLLGTINGTRAALESMRGRGGGHVVNVASLAAWVPVPGETVYAATKAGVLSFTLGLAGELRTQRVRDVRLSVVCPDGMLTPMLVDVLDSDALALSFSAPRLVTTDQVAVRVLEVLERPRLVASVPRWRGAQVRAFAGIPDAVLRLEPVFRRTGLRHLGRVRAQLSRAGASSGTGASEVSGGTPAPASA